MKPVKSLFPVRPGELTRGIYDVDENLRFPLSILDGGEPGKTVLITSGVHGCEYPGIQAVIELADELSPSELRGRVIFVHPVNFSGFMARSPEVVPEDGVNINRVFPGKEDGTAAEKLAWAIANRFMPECDFFLDLHSGDVHEMVTPFVYFYGENPPETRAASCEAARAMSLPYRVASYSRVGSLCAAGPDLPGLFIERGGNGLWTPEEVAANKLDILGLLAHLGVLPGAEPKRNDAQQEIVNTIYLESDMEGFWYPDVVPGQFIRKGESIGAIRDCYGNQLQRYYAEAKGVVLYRTTSLAVSIGTPLVAYGELR